MKMQRLLELEILNLQSVQLGQEFGGWAGTTGSGNKEKEDSLTKWVLWKRISDWIFHCFLIVQNIDIILQIMTEKFTEKKQSDD